MADHSLLQVLASMQIGDLPSCQSRIAQPEWNPGLLAAELRMHGIEYKSAMITATTVVVTAKVLQIPAR